MKKERVLSCNTHLSRRFNCRPRLGRRGLGRLHHHDRDYAQADGLIHPHDPSPAGSPAPEGSWPCWCPARSGRHCGSLAEDPDPAKRGQRKAAGSRGSLWVTSCRPLNAPTLRRRPRNSRPLRLLGTRLRKRKRRSTPSRGNPWPMSCWLHSRPWWLRRG